MIDDRTQHLNLPQPHSTNALKVDVLRLREALSTIDEFLQVVSDTADAALPAAQVGVPGGAASLDAQGRVPAAQLPEVLFGAVSYQGGWDAAANSPAIPAANAGNKGHYYLVTTGGSTMVDGHNKWVQGDWIVSDGTTWDRIANSEVFDAAAIASGVFDVARIPNLPASKILAGTLAGLLTGASLAMSMTQNDTGNNGSFICRATGSGDGNLAGMTFYQDAYAIKLGVRADGYFGLGGWSSAAWRWYSDPSGNMTASGNVSAYSDPRLKDDIEPIKDALNIICELDGVRFTWNGKSKLIGKPGERDIGVLADQVEKVLPEVVGRSIPDEENGGEQWRVVAYDKLVPVLIEAIKELKARVEKLEA